jgi:hypothetical protein
MRSNTLLMSTHEHLKRKSKKEENEIEKMVSRTKRSNTKNKFKESPKNTLFQNQLNIKEDINKGILSPVKMKDLDNISSLGSSMRLIRL